MKLTKQTFAMAAILGAVVIGGYSCKTKPPVVEPPKVDDSAARREQARLDSLRRAQEEADRIKREAEARERAQKDAYGKLSGIADQIAASSNADAANRLMADGFALASSPDITVKIMILKGETMVDYEKPTTLRRYLEYCKDVKKNPYRVDHLDFDAQNKITAINLLKK